MLPQLRDFRHLAETRVCSDAPVPAEKIGNFVRFSAISRTSYQLLTKRFSLDFCSKIVFQQPRLFGLTIKFPTSVGSGVQL
jgi:hypothetical protein